MQRPWLAPLIPLYAAGAGVFHALYSLGIRNPVKVSVPVISIGNITLGGTGKTPFAIWLLRFLISNNIRPVYLSRGYGRKTKGVRQVNPSEDTAETVGDEALMVARSLPGVPVWVGKDRVTASQILLTQLQADVIVLDDAFQHRRIFRDLDIVLLDATRMPQDDCLFPGGNLREPLSSLGRANLLVVNRVPDPVPEWLLVQLPDGIPVSTCRNIPGNPVQVTGQKADITGLPVAVLAGLGNNRQYFNLIQQAGYQVRREFPFPDHHPYSDHDIRMIIHVVTDTGLTDIFTTTKDLMRLQPFLSLFGKAGIRVWETPVEFTWVSGEAHMRLALQRILPNLPANTNP